MGLPIFQWQVDKKKKLTPPLPANYRSKKDPIKALGRTDFTKYALSTIIYLMQSSENG